MKKFFLFAALFFLVNEHSHAQCKAPVFYSMSYFGSGAPALGFSFYFHHAFIRSTIVQDKSKSVVVDNFRALDYHYPKGVIFCRMENATAKRFGFMLSIHAGGYSER
jgi:hypothetical protein